MWKNAVAAEKDVVAELDEEGGVSVGSGIGRLILVLGRGMERNLNTIFTLFTFSP